MLYPPHHGEGLLCKTTVTPSVKIPTPSRAKNDPLCRKSDPPSLKNDPRESQYFKIRVLTQKRARNCDTQLRSLLFDILPLKSG